MKSKSSLGARRIVFPGKQQVMLEDFELPTLPPTEVRIRIEFSLMSTGTENIVFNRLFVPGTHWDKWVKYPFYPGYASVGTIEAVGEEVKNLQVGDRVACRCSHHSRAHQPADKCYPIPQGIALEQAVWFAFAKIAFHGAQAANHHLGDSVLVIGAGPIGQMAVRWAAAAGAQTVLVSDPIKGRLTLAEAGGATATISGPLAENRETILKANDGHLPRAVIDSTGNAQVFQSAVGLVQSFGTLVILGDTGDPSQQFLTPDVITRGIHIVGAHDGHNTPTWNNLTISRLFFKLAATDRYPLEGLISHRFASENCAEAYRLANEDRASTMGILFDWRGH